MQNASNVDRPLLIIAGAAERKTAQPDATAVDAVVPLSTVRRRKTNYAGLANQGATCYMNSLLQVRPARVQLPAVTYAGVCIPLLAAAPSSAADPVHDSRVSPGAVYVAVRQGAG